MATRRTVLAAAAAAIAGCAQGDADGDGDGDEGDGSGPAVDPAAGELAVTSEAFAAGEAIPTRYTCDGEDVSPPLAVEGVPSAAETVAVVADDPDAPTEEPFVHWLLWNVPASATVAIPADVPTTPTVEALDGARQGTNDMDVVGYGGPCPPGGETHTYRFRIYALDRSLELTAGADRAALEEAIAGRVAAAGQLTGTYQRA